MLLQRMRQFFHVHIDTVHECKIQNYHATVPLSFFSRYNVDCSKSASLYGLAEGAFGTQAANLKPLQ